MKYDYNNLILWSNIFFLMPIFFAFEFTLYWYVLVLGLSLVLSILYHGSRETRFQKPDIFFAWLLMACNLVILLLGGLSPFLPALGCLITAALAIYVFTHQTKENYKIYHSLYHLLAAGIRLLALIVYIR